MSLPDWAIGLNQTDGCGTTWKLDSDLTVATMDGEIEVTRTSSATVTVNPDQSVTFPCPGCGKSITRSESDGPVNISQGLDLST
jgi:predicted RNA-binding Zn-ribbon protein involved in translation (DUF1610 family)